MATLEIHCRKSRYMPLLPHKLYLNGQFLGLMQQPEVAIRMPAGSYDVMIQSVIPFISSRRTVEVNESCCNILTFHDREKWWDLLFTVSILAEIVHLFLHLSPTWNLVYHILDDGSFLVWLVYEFTIRHRYFALDYTSEPLASH